nr:MAG TPA: hypothetical protein [Caudoviricetes sp.]DAM50182.1 MAG TPA: hypothetical protein [Bacteriophage sp.]
MIFLLLPSSHSLLSIFTSISFHDIIYSPKQFIMKGGYCVFNYCC